MKFAFYGRLQKEWIAKVNEALRSINNKGASILCHSALLHSLQQQGADLPFVTAFEDGSILPPDTSVFITLGGDGTFLESLEWVRESGIPVVGINFGRLGFLTGAGADDLLSLSEDLLEGRYRKQSLSLLEITSQNITGDFYPYALNELSLQRLSPCMMEIDVCIDSHVLPTYRADGLIVATPTGSTAYSLSAGGPITFPGSDVLLLSPIAPHNLNARTIVFPDTSVVEVVVHTRGSSALLNFDNRSVMVESGAKFSIRKASFCLNSLCFEGYNFVNTLSQKLLWGFDKRNGLAYE